MDLRTRTILLMCSALTLSAIGALCFAEVPSPRKKMVPYNFEMQQLAEADSLFRTGNFEAAKMRYLTLRDSKASADVSARAQFALGSVFIHYDNPFADYEAALREFKAFATLYPTHERIEQAYNWIRVLNAIQEFAEGYRTATGTLKTSQQKQVSVSKNYSTLQEAYLQCDARNDSLKEVSDSLRNRVQILEGVIEKIDRIR